MFRKLPKFNDQSYVHFITTKTFKNLPYFEDDKCCLILLEELDFYRKHLGFKVLGYVILPDHLHCLIFWDVEENPKLTISKVMQGIKGHSAVRIRDYVKTTGRLKPLLQPDESRGSHLPHKRGLKYQIWQKGFYDFNIYTKKKFYEKLNYIHNNPITAGLCESPENYQWSSHSQIAGTYKNPIFKIDFLEI